MVLSSPSAIREVRKNILEIEKARKVMKRKKRE